MQYQGPQKSSILSVPTGRRLSCPVTRFSCSSRVRRNWDFLRRSGDDVVCETEMDEASGFRWWWFRCSLTRRGSWRLWSAAAADRSMEAPWDTGSSTGCWRSSSPGCNHGRPIDLGKRATALGLGRSKAPN